MLGQIIIICKKNEVKREFLKEILKDSICSPIHQTKEKKEKAAKRKFFSGKMALQYLDICEGKVILLVHGGHF